MRTEIWYSVRNGGDGSAYPTFMESEELAEIDQEYMEEGWGESCTGFIAVEHEGPIKIQGIETAESIMADIERWGDINTPKYRALQKYSQEKQLKLATS